MTNSPSDLLSLRSRLAAITGLSDPSTLGIVGDSAHAATGGYHEGRTDLANAGVYSAAASAGSSSQDYSVRLGRDRSGLTESASAMDVGYQWPHGGNAAWLRFNNLLVAQLHANDPALAAVRACNYSPDGSTRLRTDRQYGWSVVASSDVVDIHTHIEWYRDTEGNRQASLDRIAQLAQAAVANQPLPTNGGQEMALLAGTVASGFALDETGALLDASSGVPVPSGVVPGGVAYTPIVIPGGHAATLDLYADWATATQNTQNPPATFGSDLKLRVAAGHGTAYTIRTVVLSSSSPAWYWDGGLPAGTTQVNIARVRVGPTDTRDAAPIAWCVGVS